MRILVPILATTTLAAQAPQALAETERAFAKLADEKGVSPAFSTYLAPEALIFQPRPLSGHQLHDGKPDSGARLRWEPAFAEVAASEDLGWTTGPWNWRKAASDAQAAAYGHFVSVWKRQPDGSWKVLLDLGISHSAPPAASLVLAPSTQGRPLAAPDLGSARTALLEAERHFQKQAATQGQAAAYGGLGTEDLRTYREGLLPARSRKASLALLAFGEVFQRAELEGSGLSAAGDLGYTYGLAHFKDGLAQDPLPFSFVRIWRRVAGSWQIAADIQIPASGKTPS